MVIKNKIMWLIIFLAIYLFIYKYYVYTLINVQDIITRQWYIDLNEYFFLNFRKTDMNFINKYDNKLSMYYNYFTIQTDNEIMTFAIYLKNKFSKNANIFVNYYNYNTNYHINLSEDVYFDDMINYKENNKIIIEYNKNKTIFKIIFDLHNNKLSTNISLDRVLTDVGVLTPIVGEGINISFDSILDIYSTTWITFLDRYQNIKNIINIHNI